MFHITVLAVGRLKERYLVEGTAEYLKRLAPYARVDVVEVEEAGFGESPAPSVQERIKEKEGERLLKRMRPGTFLIALDIKGEVCSSEQMAGVLGRLALEGRGDITFVIGGSLGLSRNILNRANLRLSFSKFTFPHQLMRLILLEQLYRWFKIMKGEPYHK
ncbi:MAG TPA: 23S rRNA (pseudouridine(1915)-N(3))-methyltransferase RlmH [Bacillota bacterium]|jgi:23S rRNA (pseudouridine1915-N3)-methyltransferase|nr:23S rRNA (pseudouridine(1915)-N(3))-methyltransferase RlmH [Peptococcaceae bacterium MAG4]NLW37695.1 23S rRNA (pseudouridine(1915)-N(3))-methyltransferase RlmH [Peptococcaceae bacterium]HPU35904.1 23S rRNA (pseudouridine(1915)-N(3))-methyltransferase RlmH [Bacillota bacterium]HPZ42762.1 23S rRNA (pseudouridine(1915)-N(3))-methyltransferase RlmH [Bacillota bacterium]HQD75447.1 23S rRNA (pseudouridine(1915)-N(3))-methyltransferase RlmH [Bacillota bacterium]